MLPDAPSSAPRAAGPKSRRGRVMWRQAWPALSASFLLLLGLGAFEAMLPVLGRDALLLGPTALGALLAWCMLVMLIVEAGARDEGRKPMNGRGSGATHAGHDTGGRRH